MKRKIIKLGLATYVMSLPSSWIREHGLEKGDYIEVQEEEGVLALRTVQQKKGKALTLDISKLSDKLVRGYLEEAYTLGYSSIELIHGQNINPYSHHLKKAQPMKTTELLQDVVNKNFINMEIVEQSEKRTLIKDLSAGIDAEAAKNIFNRTLFLISQQAQETLRAIEKQDKEKLQALFPTTNNTRKFILYYLRILSILPLSRNEVKVRANIMGHINIINSTYRNLIRQSVAQEELTYSKNAIQLLKLITDHLLQMKTICLEFSHEKALQFLQQREKVWDEGVAQKGTTKDFALYWNFGALMGSIWYIVREMYALELQQL